jgi:hypothetical protein
MTPEEMRTVARFASLAPSVHNTQPWRFVARPDALEVHVDLSRNLRYLDPSGRQLHLSCGAASEFARLAIRALGYSCQTQMLPDPADPTLVATITTTGREPPTEAEQRLIEAATRRYTDRGAYSDEPVSPEALDRLRQTVSELGCWLQILDRSKDRLAATTLLSGAESTETADAEYQAELAQWRRTGHATDGVPTAAYATWDDESRVSDVPLRDFSGHDAHRRPGDGPPPHVQRDTLVLLGTEFDDPQSWLPAGRALAKLLLALTDDNLVSQPLGPVLDLPAARGRLRHELGLVGYPQLMLRIGHGLGRPATGRRPIRDVLTVGSSPPPS